jgi:hypothetical protein
MARESNKTWTPNLERNLLMKIGASRVCLAMAVLTALICLSSAAWAAAPIGRITIYPKKQVFAFKTNAAGYVSGLKKVHVSRILWVYAWSARTSPIDRNGFVAGGYNSSVSYGGFDARKKKAIVRYTANNDLVYW